MIGKLLQNIKDQLVPQQTFDINLITSQLKEIHQPTFTNYSKILQTLQTTNNYLKSESFHNKEYLIQEIIGTEFLNVFSQRKFNTVVNPILQRCLDLLQFYSSQEFYDYINNSILQIQRHHPENIEPLPLLLKSIKIKINSSIGNIKLPYTIQKDVLELLITYSGVSQETRQIINQYPYFFNKYLLLQQFQAGLKGEVITLIDESQDQTISIFNITDILNTMFLLQYDRNLIFQSIKDFIIENLVKFITSQCYKNNTLINHSFAADLIYLLATILNLTHQNDITLFLKLVILIYPQVDGFYVETKIMFYDKSFSFSPIQQLILDLLTTPLDQSIPLSQQLRLKNTIFVLIIQIISATPNQSTTFETFQDLALTETSRGLIVKKRSKSLEMNADLLQNAHLFRMAQISAGMPRFELVNSEIANPNPFVFEALQQFLGLFTMLKNNDFCGDDAQVSYQEGGEQQELIQTSFRVENDCILQVKATYLNYRQFVGFLVLANPHFYDQICAICSVVEESVTKMSAHVAFLKANGVGFFAKISFFDEFQAILDSVVDGRDERAAMVTGWLLLCKKNGQ